MKFLFLVSLLESKIWRSLPFELSVAPNNQIVSFLLC